MPPVIKPIQVFLYGIPSPYLWALMGLFLLLLVLLITRRKKSDAQVSEQPPDLLSDETGIEEQVPPQPTDEPGLTEAPPVQPSKASAPPSLEETSRAPDKREVTNRDQPEPSRQEAAPFRQDDVAEEKVETTPRQPLVEKPSGLFARLKQGLTKTRQFLNIDDLFQGRKKIDDELIEDLEELLITADVGVQTTMDLIDRISHHKANITDADQLRSLLKAEIQLMLKADLIPGQEALALTESTPHVIMVIGVNGVGKTTTIGKLAAHYSAENKKVLIAAADTFRAAAVEQAAIWAERSNADIVRHKDGSDPAAVAYDGVEAGLARGCDIVLIDTAGRLHTKINLMEELKKIKRSVDKKLPGAPHEILLVLDATTGQNALTQAKIFHEALNVTGIALTKLDGTAKGGIVLSICKSLNVPLMYIGVGEQINDLQAFDAEKFVDALF
jgi:fused signal recognition particle receptor